MKSVGIITLGLIALAVIVILVVVEIIEFAIGAVLFIVAALIIWWLWKKLKSKID